VAAGRGRSRRVSVPGVAELSRPADLDARGAESLAARRIRASQDTHDTETQVADEDTVPSLTWEQLLAGR
jgi:hypothetical protein